jgi:hypothetical protein
MIEVGRRRFLNIADDVKPGRGVAIVAGVPAKELGR